MSWCSPDPKRRPVLSLHNHTSVANRNWTNTLQLSSIQITYEIITNTNINEGTCLCLMKTYTKNGVGKINVSQLAIHMQILSNISTFILQFSNFKNVVYTFPHFSRLSLDYHLSYSPLFLATAARSLHGQPEEEKGHSLPWYHVTPAIPVLYPTPFTMSILELPAVHTILLSMEFISGYWTQPPPSSPSLTELSGDGRQVLGGSGRWPLEVPRVGKVIP